MNTRVYVQVLFIFAVMKSLLNGTYQRPTLIMMIIIIIPIMRLMMTMIRMIEDDKKSDH